MTLSDPSTHAKHHATNEKWLREQHHKYVKMDAGKLDEHTFLQEVLKSRRELQIARQQFDQVADPLLIDHVVFRIGAAERHLNYLFKLAREHQIEFEGMQADWMDDAWQTD